MAWLRKIIDLSQQLRYNIKIKEPTTLEEYRARLAEDELDLKKFEIQYGIPSTEFYQKFEQGQLGDAMDFFEWSGLYEMHQNTFQEIQEL